MHFAPYDQPVLAKSIWQLVNTFIPFGICWAAAYFSLAIHVALSLVFSVVTGFLLLRIFIIFHDCCHRSFFKRRAANEWLGFITGVLTFTPYEQWKNTHATHHATSGNLDKRGTGDIWTVTLREFSAMPRWKKMLYGMYRNPLMMFFVGPIYIFLLDYRVNRKQASQKERWNTYLTNLGIVLLMTALCFVFGWQAVLLVQIPIFMISGMAGIWLFYVQHQFEQSYYEASDAWTYKQAALQGSSFFHLPKWLHWLTGNIGYHHIHHLNPRVPNYHLPLLFRNNAELREVPTITLKNSFATLRLRFWDEQAKKMVGWREWRAWKRTFNL
jgi:omega-6 fatty acid desaturase (delta-12 desaturase)